MSSTARPPDRARWCPAVEPMTVDTVFDVASLTKVVATMPAVLALWETGEIDLDAPLGRYLKEFAGPAFREVTIRRLLTHSVRAPRSAAPRGHGPRAFPRRRALQAKAGLAVRARIDLRLQRHRLHPARARWSGA